MDTAKIPQYIFIVTLCAAVVFFMYVIGEKRKAIKAASRVNYRQNKKNHVYALYRFYSKAPILRRYFKKIRSRVETLYPADDIAVTIRATNFTTKALAVALFFGILIIVIAQGDVFYIGVGVVTVYIIFTQIVTSSIESLELKLDKQMSNFLSDVRHFYHDTGDVADAVFGTLDDLPPEIGLHISKIYQVLISTNVEQAAAKYNDIAPNRFLKTFVAICSTIKEYGDLRLEDGQWLFLKNLNYLKEEVNIEILKKEKSNYLFSGLKFVAISPMFFLKLIELWATNNVPELSTFYQSAGGTITMVITFVLTIASYTMIGNLKDGRVSDFKEYKLLNKIATLPVIRKILTAEINRNYSKSLRIGDNLKMVGENMSPSVFLLKRIIYGLVVVIAFNALVFTMNGRTKESLMNDFSDAFENSIVPNDEYRETMREVGKDYAKFAVGTPDTAENREALTDEIVEEQGLKRTYANIITEEIFTRIDKYADIYYKWYNVLIACLVFWVGFMIPRALLAYQVAIMNMSMEDEVIQYQTVALILMHVSGIGTDTLLEWIERFAFCFKDSVSECIINLEYSVQGALLKMKNKEPFPPFKRFVDNLLSIDNVGMASAFDEIETEREYYQKKREQDNEIIINKKSQIAKICAFAPLIAVIGLHLIYPFLSMAVEMMGTMKSALGSM